MLLWIIQITFVSIIFIFLIHYLIEFFKSTLTIPKIKDLVNSPSQKYENMYNIIKNSTNANINANINANSNANSNANANTDYTLIELLPKQEENGNMKSELKNFLKKQMQGTSQSVPLDTLSSGSTYSSF